MKRRFDKARAYHRRWCKTVDWRNHRGEEMRTWHFNHGNGTFFRIAEYRG